MLPTHALSGMLLALPLLFLAPVYAPIALVAGFLGGIFPDLDMYRGHRKTLHYPVYYSMFALSITPIAFLAPSTVTIGLVFFLAGAALHSITDIFGSGLELRPWEARSNRAVYNHYRQHWIRPRRLVKYDGSPGDLLLSVGLAVPLLYSITGTLEWLVIGAISVAVLYTILRRTLAELAGRIVTFIPPSFHQYLPDRYLEPAQIRTS